MPALYGEAKSLVFINTYYLIRLCNKEQGRHHQAQCPDEEMGTEGLSHEPQVTSLSLNSSPRVTLKPMSLFPLSPPVHGAGRTLGERGHCPRELSSSKGGANMGGGRGVKGPECQAKVGSGLHSLLQED